MFFYGLENGGCLVAFGIPNSDGGSMLRTFKESYETINGML